MYALVTRSSVDFLLLSLPSRLSSPEAKLCQRVTSLLFKDHCSPLLGELIPYQR